jgi:hypothetical protein
MARMGDDSERAALIYLHSSAERQRALAAAAGDTARAALSEPGQRKKADSSGTRMARARCSQSALVGRQGSLPAQVGRPDRDSNAGPTA